MTGVRHIDKYKTVLLAAAQTPSSFTSSWINMAKFSHATVFIHAANGNTVTGSAVSFNQALDTSGGGSKALPFSLQWSNVLATSTDSLTQNNVTSNTFTTATTNGASLLYVVEIHDTDFDLAANPSFAAFQVLLGTAANTTVTAWAHLYPRYRGNFATIPTSLS